MGYDGKHELIQALTELLEGERAGVRVGTRLVAMARMRCPWRGPSERMRAAGAGCWSGAAALRRDAFAKVGDFYDKVMATKGLQARLALINRGQGWVVRKLEALLPKVHDDQLHADLRAMLEAHVGNIELTERTLARRVAGRTP